MNFKRISFILLFLCFSFASSKNEDIEKRILFQAQKFKYILETLYKNYADTVNIEELSEIAFKTLLQNLDDQSAYYTKEQREKFKSGMLGTKVGIGIQVQYMLTIVNVIEKSPADSIGLKIGDKILFINGINTITASKSDISDLLNGEEGEEIHLILREFPTGVLKERKFNFRSFHISSISAIFKIYNTNYWYIDIDNFTKTIIKDFERVSEKLFSADGLIIDLRGNPGGYLDKVCRFITNFLPKELIITYTEARNPEFKVTYKADRNGQFRDIPIILIIDKSSASASEIFAGVMQDYDRGFVVGEQSFGKGSVQKFWDMTDGTAFKATVAKYFTPLGRMVQKTTRSNIPQIDIDPAITFYGGKEAEKKITELLQKTGGITQIPIYKTAKGRVLLGMGGIMPDYIVARDTTTPLVGALNQKGIFLQWALDYLSQNSHSVKFKFGEKFDIFANNFNLNQEEIDKFIVTARQNGIWNDEMFKKDEHLIIELMKASIANSIWGTKGMKAVTVKFDRPILKAIELMPEAKELINKK